jgi:hypothetical protein
MSSSKCGPLINNIAKLRGGLVRLNIALPTNGLRRNDDAIKINAGTKKKRAKLIRKKVSLILKINLSDEIYK